MTRPHGLLRAGYPYLKTLGMRRITNFPTDIAFGKNDMSYILCRSEGVALIRIWPLDDMAEQTDSLQQIGSFGSGDGQFIWPVQLVTNPDGDIFVSDEGTHRITRFDPDGEFVAKWGLAGEAEGEFNGPTGIAFDPDGNLVVVDSKNHRIQTYTLDGTYLGGFGAYGSKPGQFDLPWGIHVDEFSDIYVADWGNNRVQIFSRDGVVKNVVGRSGADEGEFDRPTGIAVDGHGDIYVADWGNNRVQMFNAEGQYIWTFRGNASLSRVARSYMLTNAVPNRLRETGRLEQEQYLRHPRSVRINDAFQLFIADYESYRIQVYQKDAMPLDQTQFAEPLRNPTLEVT